jgi:proteasome lid subunit RPN8/RPN11
LSALKSLWLTSDQAKQIAQQAADQPTEEICGLLFGSLSLTSNQPPVTQIVAIDNITAHPAARYEMHPAQLVTAQLQAARQGLELVGIYHSHPNGQPIPSSIDVSEAHYLDAVYLIVVLQDDDARFAAWSIVNDEVTSVPFQISDHAPSDVVVEAAMSQPEKVAVVLSAILAVVFLMVVSLSLLPPAPPLPN